MTSTATPSSPSSTTAEAEGRYCPACRTEHVGTFLPGPGGRPDASCPSCMSLERERFLAVLLDCLSPALARPSLLLDIAPSARTTPLYRALQPRHHVTLDFDPAADERQVDIRASITEIPLPTGSVDLLTCYHVLEHVPDDRAAMREIARVLGDRGFALVQVPWRADQPTDEDPSAVREDRIRRFGQADHVRYYGGDFEERLVANGLQTRRVTPLALVGPEACRWMRLNPAESVWVAQAADCPERAGAIIATTSGVLRDTLSRLLGHLAEQRQDWHAEHGLRVHAEARLEHAGAELAQAVSGAREAHRERDLWRSRHERLHRHWLLRTYRALRRPVVRALGRR